MKNKKLIMFFAALMILIFHLWIYINPITSNLFKIEVFIRTICYIGVDIFFFVSAFSISNKEIKNYREFIFSRFKKIYIPFIIFGIINAIYNNWNIKKLILTVTSIDLFIRGGGSFLWFIPAIMYIYLLLPLINKIKNKKKCIILMVIWLLLALILTNTNNTQLLILINRIPIILIAVLLSETNILNKINKYIYLIISIILFIIGIIIMYNFYALKIKYIYDINYIIAIPLIISIIMLLNILPTNKIIDKISRYTLEIYAFQMIIGSNIINEIFKFTKKPLLINIISIITIVFISIIYGYTYNKIIELLKKKKFFLSNSVSEQ